MSFVLFLGYWVSCTKDDQPLDTPQVVNSSTDLVTVKTTTAPTIDGTVDAMWENSPKLQFSTAVPEVTGDVFRGYTGNIIPSVTLRSAYDDNNIYFLAEWDDPTQSFARQVWYFDPGSKTWQQEKGAPVFTVNSSGVATLTRQAFYEDKIAFLWNINNSVNGWNSATCYKSCHTGLPAADGSSRHFTNYPTEKIDMWHWKSVRGGVNAAFQIHDQFQDNSYPNGRKGDLGGTDVYLDNRITISGLTVPKYVILNRANNYWILNSEITSGTAKLVTGVDANGVLTFSDNSTLDPNIGTDYLRAGANAAPKAIAGVTINDAGYGGNQADISCKAVWAGAKWTLEFKRKLTTGDALDIDFASLTDQYFGFAIFENAQIAHSIKPNLVLKFRK